uniref:Uncharacterized protein n=1 Tax=Sphaerodactylus townsendi TaxID=933632 RepID=A0ACB8ECE0_9SAUR
MPFMAFWTYEVKIAARAPLETLRRTGRKAYFPLATYLQDQVMAQETQAGSWGTRWVDGSQAWLVLGIVPQTQPESKIHCGSMTPEYPGFFQVSAGNPAARVERLGVKGKAEKNGQRKEQMAFIYSTAFPMTFVVQMMNMDKAFGIHLYDNLCASLLENKKPNTFP